MGSMLMPSSHYNIGFTQLNWLFWWC